jgi:hypothetical protein
MELHAKSSLCIVHTSGNVEAEALSHVSLGQTMFSCESQVEIERAVEDLR